MFAAWVRLPILARLMVTHNISCWVLLTQVDFEVNPILFRRSCLMGIFGRLVKLILMAVSFRNFGEACTVRPRVSNIVLRGTLLTLALIVIDHGKELPFWPNIRPERCLTLGLLQSCVHLGL